MIHFRFTALVAILFIATLVISAPLEDSSPSSTTTTPAPTTSTSSSTSTPAPPTTSAPAPAPEPSSSTNATTPDQTSSAPATSAADEPGKMANSTTFTCFDRPIGYYADEERDCKVYHFCLKGDFNGDTVYQRISYLCLGETVFDQQALDCLAADKITTPCKESHNHYEMSNNILRQAIVGYAQNKH